MAGINYLKQLPYVDANRIGLFGSSHGAYMSLVTAALVGDQVKAVVENFGFTNLIAQYHDVVERQVTCHTKDQKEVFAEMANRCCGGPPSAENRQIYEERSPYFSAEKIASPILIIHGKNDLSVPIAQQTYAFAEALARAGKTYELKVYEDGPHGFIYEDNVEAKDALGATISFLNEHLGKGGKVDYDRI